MRVKSLILLTLACSVCMFSCKKVPLTIGKTITISRPLDDFNKVYIHDDISMTLVKSDSCWIEITTGENLIDNITTKINMSDSSFSIKNGNQMSFLRPYDYTLHATLYFKDIIFLKSSTSGYVDTYNQLNGQEKCKIVVDGASGDMDITINDCPRLEILYRFGTGKANFHGNNNTKIYINKSSYGILDARDCTAEKVTVTNWSIGDCYISASKVIKAEIFHLGDIYYKGDPEQITEKYGPIARGRLIKL